MVRNCQGTDGSRVAHFTDPAGGFFDTADDHERLVTRPKDVQDNAVPSGNAMAARVLFRLAAWTGEGSYRDAAERAVRAIMPFGTRYPTAFAQCRVRWTSHCASVEVAIVGDPADATTAELIERPGAGSVRTRFRPSLPIRPPALSR